VDPGRPRLGSFLSLGGVSSKEYRDVCAGPHSTESARISFLLRPRDVPARNVNIARPARKDAIDGVAIINLAICQAASRDNDRSITTVRQLIKAGRFVGVFLGTADYYYYRRGGKFEPKHTEIGTDIPIYRNRQPRSSFSALCRFVMTVVKCLFMSDSVANDRYGVESYGCRGSASHRALTR